MNAFVVVKVKPMVCAGCTARFVPVRHQRFHSAACRAAAWRASQKVKEAS